MPRENSSAEGVWFNSKSKGVSHLQSIWFSQCMYTELYEPREKKNCAIQISTVFLINQFIKVFQRNSDISGIMKYFRSYSVTSNIILLYIFMSWET